MAHCLHVSTQAHHVADPSPPSGVGQVLKGGVPRLELSCGGGAVLKLIYDRDMDAWLRIADSRFAVSDYMGLSGTGTGVNMSTVLRSEQEREARAEVTRAHLEEKLAGAVVLGEKEQVGMRGAWACWCCLRKRRMGGLGGSRMRKTLQESLWAVGQ